MYDMYLQGDVAKVLVLPHVVESDQGVVLEAGVLPHQPGPLRTQFDHLGVQVFLRVRDVAHPVAVH